MKKIVFTLARLLLGLWVCSMGIVFMINARLGLAPWDVLHEGLSKNLGITMGQANRMVGFTILGANFFLKEFIGWGTLLNMLLIGFFVDVLMINNLIPVSTNLFTGILMLLSGMVMMSFGIYLYMGSGIGSGARDGMMSAIVKRTGKPVKIVRGMLELSALTLGYFLGGTIGIGTVITSLGMGFCLQSVFKLCRFNVAELEHRYIIHDIRDLKKRLIRA